MLPAAVEFSITLGSIGLALALFGWKRSIAQGLTLTGPWWWSVIALGTLGVAETAIFISADYRDPSVSEPLRFVALTCLFTPFMSLLGAKRPQHNAWHFIVLSLWAILALPAAETLFLQRGQALEVYDARCWFLLALVIVSGLNLGLTRWWLSAVLLAVAKTIMLAEYLPGLRTLELASWPQGERIAAGAAVIAIAAGLPLAGLPARRSAAPWDRLWCDFRDSFGALWAIRVAEQINQSAEQLGWSFRLSWNGFRQLVNGQPLEASPFDEQPVLAQVMQNLLRRFVNDQWTQARLGKPFSAWKQPPTE